MLNKGDPHVKMTKTILKRFVLGHRDVTNCGAGAIRQQKFSRKL